MSAVTAPAADSKQLNATAAATHKAQEAMEDVQSINIAQDLHSVYTTVQCDDALSLSHTCCMSERAT